MVYQGRNPLSCRRIKALFNAITTKTTRGDLVTVRVVDNVSPTIFVEAFAGKHSVDPAYRPLIRVRPASPDTVDLIQFCGTVAGWLLLYFSGLSHSWECDKLNADMIVEGAKVGADSVRLEFHRMMGG